MAPAGNSGIVSTKEQDAVMTSARRTSANRRFLAIMAIVAMAVVLGACAPAAGPAPSAAPLPGLVGQINAQRAANGLGSLTVDGGLTDIANAWADHLAATGGLAHQDLNTIPGWNNLGETVEVGPCGQSDQSIVTAWINSGPHRDVLLSAAFQVVGVGTLCDFTGREWVVADFGG